MAMPLRRRMRLKMCAPPSRQETGLQGCPTPTEQDTPVPLTALTTAPVPPHFSLRRRAGSRHRLPPKPSGIMANRATGNGSRFTPGTTTFSWWWQASGLILAGPMARKVRNGQPTAVLPMAACSATPPDSDSFWPWMNTDKTRLRSECSRFRPHHFPFHRRNHIIPGEFKGVMTFIKVDACRSTLETPCHIASRHPYHRKTLTQRYSCL